MIARKRRETPSACARGDRGGEVVIVSRKNIWVRTHLLNAVPQRAHRLVLGAAVTRVGVRSARDRRQDSAGEPVAAARLCAARASAARVLVAWRAAVVRRAAAQTFAAPRVSAMRSMADT
jgi:hypothetical protein